MKGISQPVTVSPLHVILFHKTSQLVGPINCQCRTAVLHACIKVALISIYISEYEKATYSFSHASAFIIFLESLQQLLTGRVITRAVALLQLSPVEQKKVPGIMKLNLYCKIGRCNQVLRGIVQSNSTTRIPLTVIFSITLKAQRCYSNRNELVSALDCTIKVISINL